MRCIFLCCLVLLHGCALNQLSVAKSAHAPATPYGRVMLHVEAPLDTRQSVAKALLPRLSARASTQLVNSVDLFFPGTKYAPRDYARIMRANKVDAVLHIQILGTKSVESYIPIPTFSNSTTTISGDIHATAETTTTNTQMQPIATTVAQYRVLLIDVQRAQVVWMADGSTSDLYGAATKLIAALLDSGLVAKKAAR